MADNDDITDQDESEEERPRQGLTIRTNVSSLGAHHLTRSNESLSSSLTRLSTGLKVNTSTKLPPPPLLRDLHLIGYDRSGRCRLAQSDTRDSVLFDL